MASMDESILTLDEETMPISSVLVSMGINVKKQNYGTRLKGALDNFNACYLDAMDFLKQILPLAKQHFAQHDAILLPKTPSKKRTRKHLQGKQVLNDIIEQTSPPPEDKENTEPNIKLESSEVTTEQSVKRTTRSSRTSRKQEETTRQTRSQKRNSLKQDRDSNVAETKPHVTFNAVQNKLHKPVELENEKSTAQMNLKRSSSTSPSLKQRTKRSRSGDSTPVVTSNTVEDEINIPDNLQGKCVGAPLQVLPSDEELDRNEQNSTAKNVSNGVLVQGHGTEENEHDKAKDEVPEPLIDKSNMDIKENLMDQSLMHQAEMRKNKRKESSDDDSDELNAKKRKSEEVTNSVASPVEIKTSMGGKTMDLSPCIIPESPAQSERHAEEVAAPITASSPEEPNMSSPSSCNTGNAQKVLNQDKAQETVSQNEETRVEETPEENKSARSNAEPVASPQPYVRRSTRSSRRISKVSLSKRRSSRRISRANRQSSCSFKKPLSVNKVRDVCSENDPDSGMDCRTSDQGKVSPVLKDLSSTESEDELRVKSVGPSTSTPDVEKKPRTSSRKASVKKEQKKQSKGSSSDETFEPPISEKVGKVAGIVQGINRNTKVLDERTNISVNGTPNGVRKMKRFGSAVKRSSTKPSNLVGGNIRSFISRPSTKKLDPGEVVRLKKLELQRKEEKEKERKDQAELRRKNWADEQKRKREEKQKRVVEAKAAREKEEQEKKERQLEEKKQMLLALEQAKKKREQEEESKKKLREQRKKEADARRLKENEDRLKRLHEKEEDERVYREMFKRKQEHEELERKQKILEEKRQQEQKQRERQRELAEERQRKLREIKEKEQKRVGKEIDEARLLAEKNKEEAERKERETKQKEAEERETKRIAQLIKEKVAQDKKLYEEKLQKEEKERREREEQRKQREAHKPNQFSSAAGNKSALQAQSADSYMMTPPPAQTRKPPTNENYDISDIRSDESTDDEDCPRKRVPSWAQGEALKLALFNQVEPRKLFEMETGPYVVHPPDLDKIFQKKRKRFYYRTSSAHWDSPPIKKDFLM